MQGKSGYKRCALEFARGRLLAGSVILSAIVFGGTAEVAALSKSCDRGGRFAIGRSPPSWRLPNPPIWDAARGLHAVGDVAAHA